MSVQRKCPECGTWNNDEHFCTNCGALLDPVLIEEQREEEREERRRNTPPSKLDVFIDKWKNHPFFLFKALYYILYTIGFIFFAVASFFAWIAASPNG